MRALSRVLGGLVGVVGSVVFVVAVLAAVAPPAASGVPGPCEARGAGLFSPCAPLDVSTIDDLRRRCSSDCGLPD